VSAIPYSIRRSDRARRARVQVSAEGVEVVVPRRLPLSEVEPFVEEKRRWIERTLRRMREAEAEQPPPRLVDGGEVPLLGERLELRVHVDPGRTRPHVRRGAVRFGSPAPSPEPRDVLHVHVGRPGVDALRDALERWYRRLARAEIEPRLDAAAARAGVAYSGLQIRGQRTRWASCSSSGAMSFNWRLLLASAEIVDYVVEHEVAHLDVHDHSDEFWALLERRVPEYREYEAWLRRHGQSLRL
jgi:predicted metal-dependent hydrolase